MAFQREIPVVPVLLDQTPIPTREQLPDDIQLLPLSIWHRVRHESLTADVLTLIEKLDVASDGTEVASRQPGTQHTVVDRRSVAYVNQNGSQIINVRGQDGTAR